jgi:ubiquinone/menaquinone biosynthesis C-methylase UbiE
VSDFDDAVRASWAGKAAAFERSFAALCGYPAGDLLDAVGPLDARTLLDVGTGTGTVAVLAAERGALTVGVDQDAGMLALARAKAKTAVFGIDTLPDLHWRDEAFDAVVANFVVNHVGDPRSAVAELARVAKPGGRVAVTIWPHPKSPVLAVLDQMVVESAVEASPAGGLPEHLDFARDEEGLAGILTEAGLADVTVTRISWIHRTTFDDLWAGMVGGVTSIGALVVSQSPETVQRMKSTLALLLELYRDGEEIALPAEALLASGRRPAEDQQSATEEHAASS